MILFFFFFNDTATTEIYTLSLHDALPICPSAQVTSYGASVLTRSRTIWSRLVRRLGVVNSMSRTTRSPRCSSIAAERWRSEEHTSELQSQSNLVCRLLLEKKKNHIHDMKICRENVHVIRLTIYNLLIHSMHVETTTNVTTEKCVVRKQLTSTRAVQCDSIA